MDFTSNRLLFLFATLAIGFLAFLGFKDKAGEPSQPATTLPGAPQPATSADADSPKDTLEAVLQEVKGARQENSQLRQDNAALLAQKNDLRTEITNQVKDDLNKGSPKDTAMANMVKQLAEQMSAMNSRLDQKEDGNNPSIPAGIGNAMTGQGGTITVEPLNAGGLFKKLGNKVDGLQDDASQALQGAADSSGSLLHGLDNNALVKSHLPGQNLGLVAYKPPEPVYTVPRNATLVGGTAMTALIGRIPIKGHIDDPYPFKVIVGSENLAANGLEIPGLDGMIATGKAFGDWTLGCVRGEIHSVTFNFEDGTIRSLSSDDQSLQQKTQQNNQASGNPAQTNPTNANNRPLGWLSDRRGINCVSGSRITNAPQYLGGRFLSRAVGAAGEAYARSQTTVQSIPGFGGFNSAVTGNPTEYALGATASGAADELAQWIAERQAQNYDAVFVDTGAEVALHIDIELPIDYEPSGRKLAHARKRRGNAPVTQAKLD